MQNQITSEVHVDELFVIETEERLETVQIAAAAVYTSCALDMSEA